jgi:N-acetylglucosaminyl-diphospho-decaprenol L-rhamnosyltransferase
MGSLGWRWWSEASEPEPWPCDRIRSFQNDHMSSAGLGTGLSTGMGTGPDGDESVTAALIGIVSWNSAAVLDACLAALPAAADGLDYRVVVYDNGSSDGSPVVASSFPRVSVIQGTENIGYGRAMNRALSDPDGRYEVLIALNPDTVCPPGSLRRLCDDMLLDPGVGLVVPALRYPDGSHQASVYRFPSVAVSIAASFLPLALQRGWIGRHFALEAGGPNRASGDIDWAIGAVHVIRSSARSGQPVYNERWFMYAEDLDLCWTLGEQGWRRRVNPDVVVTHIGNVSGHQAWGSRRTELWLNATYDWYLVRQGGPAARRWAAANALGVLWRLLVKRVRRAAGRSFAPWEEQLRPALRVHWHYLRHGELREFTPLAPPR